MLKGEFSGQKNSPKLSKNKSSQCFLDPLTIYLLAWEIHATSSCLINAKKLACLSKYDETWILCTDFVQQDFNCKHNFNTTKKSYNYISILSLSCSWAKSLTE